MVRIQLSGRMPALELHGSGFDCQHHHHHHQKKFRQAKNEERTPLCLTNRELETDSEISQARIYSDDSKLGEGLVTEEKGFESCFEGQGTPDKGYTRATGYEIVPLPVWLNEKSHESFLDIDKVS